MSTGLFDPRRGSMIHYFIRPNDTFVLNSLEMLDADTYLYRLLREEGFEMLFFINIDENNCSVWTYDKLSYWACREPKKFSGVNIKDKRSVRAFIEQLEGRTKPGLNLKHTNTADPKPGKKAIPHVGKVSVQGFATESEFTAFMTDRISPALNAKNAKTAVVIPMELFEKKGYLAETTVDIIRRAQKHNSAKKSIIVLTTPRKNNIINCLDFDHFRELHYWVPKVLNRLSEEQDRVDACLQELRQENILVLADQICADEIANLLLRKKLIDRDDRYAGLQLSKIYGLAELLAEHCRMEKRHFKSFHPFRMHDYIQQLNSYMDDDEVIAELIAKSATLMPRAPKATNGLPAVALERVTNRHEARYTYSEEERLLDYNAAMTALHDMIGLEPVKTAIDALMEKKQTYPEERYPGHYVFAGNPGTGKTEVAKLMGKILKAIGLLKKGHFVDGRKSQLVGSHVGESKKLTLQKCEEALDGILFVDEAYELVNHKPDGSDFASPFDEEAYTEILKFMEDHRDRICVIFAGYANKMDTFLDANDGMRARVSQIIEFPNYSDAQLLDILKFMATRRKFRFEEEIDSILLETIAMRRKNCTGVYANARDMRNFLDEITTRIALRMKTLRKEKRFDEIDVEKYIIRAQDVKPDSENEVREDVNTAMASLNDLIGLTEVKTTVRSIVNRVRFPSKSSRKVEPGHYIFTGNPGTGKTEVARMMGRIFASMGVLSKRDVVEVSRSKLVAGYVGQTAKLVEAKCKEALGGVLFVDEAYTLFAGGTNNDFGKEALDTLMKFMEDNRHQICVIFAGYKEPMLKLMEVNKGFASRITEIIHFPDYSVEELMEIMHFMADRQEFVLAPDFVEAARKFLARMVAAKTDTFGNARDVRNLLNAADGRRANRIAEAVENGQDPNTIQMNRLIAADLTVDSGSSDQRTANKAASYRRIPGEPIQALAPLHTDAAHKNEILLGQATDSAVLLIKTDVGYGTAFLISPDGYALTCNHVVSGAKKIDARFRMPGRAGGDDSWYYNCEVINAKMDLDIALIKLDGTNFPYLSLAAEDRVIYKSEKFILSGYPLGSKTAKDLTTFHGYVASTDRQRDENDLIRYNINGEAKSGDSGAPIIALSDGRVIGILLGSITVKTSEILTEEINYMRPIQYFWEEFVE